MLELQERLWLRRVKKRDRPENVERIVLQSYSECLPYPGEPIDFPFQAIELSGVTREGESFRHKFSTPCYNDNWAYQRRIRIAKKYLEQYKRAGANVIDECVEEVRSSRELAMEHLKGMLRLGEKQYYNTDDP